MTQENLYLRCESFPSESDPGDPTFEKDRFFYDFNQDGVMDELRVVRVSPPMNALSENQLVIYIQ